MANRLDPANEATRNASGPPDPPEVSDRGRAVLDELGREGEAHVAFQGLKRRLELHPQQLTRTLDRLAEAGLVVESDDGYRLTETGHAGRPEDGRGPCCDRALLQVMLPPWLEAGRVEEHLSERWFDPLRWYGRAGGPGETVLIWTTADDHQAVRLRLEGSVATITTDACGQPDREVYGGVHRLSAALGELFDEGNSHAAS